MAGLRTASTTNRRIITAGAEFPHRLHAGHFAEKVIADTYRRYWRMRGEDARLVVGMDQHSQRIVELAEGEGKSPAEFCQSLREHFEETWKRLNVGYDVFLETGAVHHRQVVEEVIRRCVASGDIYLAERTIHYCGNCDANKRPFEIEHNTCKDCHEPIVDRTGWFHFFRLSKYQPRLIEFLTTNPEFVQPKRAYHQLLGNLRSGDLHDYAISTPSSGWGIPFPIHDERTKKSVVWVWFDSLALIWTSTGFQWNDELHRSFGNDHYHIVGRDILKFIALLGLSMAWSANLPVSRKILTHGLLMAPDGNKISASKGNGIEVTQDAECLGTDALRYYFARSAISDGRDLSYAPQALREVYNQELVGLLSDTLQKITGLVAQQLGGRIVSTSEVLFKREAKRLYGEYHEHMEKGQVHQAADILRQLLMKYREEMERPGILNAIANSHWDFVDRYFLGMLEMTRHLALLAWPIIPSSAEEILRRIGITDDPTSGLETVSLEVRSDIMRQRAITHGAPIFVAR